jgi:hypothetical protein
MAPLNKNTQVFLSLVRTGLWEQDVQLASFGQINFNEVYRLAEEQSVVGLVAAGLEHVKDVKVPQEVALTFAGSTLQLEQRNTAMNYFVATLIEKLRAVDIYSILVKGQGIAQCYERPLWRACGDVDLLLDENNYKKSKAYLSKIASDVEKEDEERRHLAITIEPWIVELHGSLRVMWSRRVDKIIDGIQNELFKEGKVRVWRNGETDVFLPSPDNDVIFIFAHILQHFFVEGIGLRQICDWCRLLYTYRDSLNREELKNRILLMGLKSEWKVFAALAVDYLGMPEMAMPFYDKSRKWSKKANRIMLLVLETGNFGHNRDKSYKIKYPSIIRYAISFHRHTYDMIRKAIVFPFTSFSVWCHTMWMIAKG